MSNQALQQYESVQAQELSNWVENRKRLRRVQVPPMTYWLTEEEKREQEQMRKIEMAMNAVGLTCVVLIILAIFALVAYWISPWMIVSMLSLAAFMWSWAKYKGRW